MSQCKECKVKLGIWFCQNEMCEKWFCQECDDDYHTNSPKEARSKHKRVQADASLEVKKVNTPVEITKEQIEADYKNKFIGVNHSGDLFLGQRYDFVSRLDLPLKNTNSMLLLGMIGPTGAGKSHFSKMITDPRYGIPISSGSDTSTSSDVNAFIGMVKSVIDQDGSKKEEQTNFLLLDTEGIYGTVETKMKNESNIGGDVIVDFTKVKQKYVDITYPRLSYLFADVVCFVTTVSPREKDKLSQILTNFSLSAASNSAVSQKPLLLVIFNKVDPKETRTPKEATDMYFYAPDSPTKSLGLYYDDPTVVTVADRKDVELYNKTVDELLNIIKTKLAKKFDEKNKESKLWPKAHLSEIKKAVTKMDKDPNCVFTPVPPPDVFDKNSKEKQRKQIIKYLLEQATTCTNNNVDAFSYVTTLVEERFIDSCLLEGLKEDVIQKKKDEIEKLLRENMPCTAFTNEFPGVGTVFCELKGPASSHTNSHKSTKTYKPNRELTEFERQTLRLESVPDAPCWWLGEYQQPSIDFKLQKVFEQQMSEVPTGIKEREKFIPAKHQQILKEQSVKMVDIYPHNSCVSCFTDNEDLEIKVCGHGVCKTNCIANKLREWIKPWCPLCDHFFQAGSIKSDKEEFLGLTELFLAAMQGDEIVVKKELKKDIYKKIDTKIKSGFSPFWVAIKRGNYDVANLILQAGVIDVNSVLKLNDRTVLFDIIEHGKETEGLLKSLFTQKSCIQVNTMDKDQTTLLHYATMHNNVTAVALLLENGASSNEDKYGYTPLHIAVENGFLDVVKILCSTNPSTQQTYVNMDHLNSKTGLGPLHLAVMKGHYDIASTLLQSGANPNLEDSENGRTPFYICVENYFTHIVDQAY